MILEAIIPESGPAWVIAIGLIGNIIVQLVPAIKARYDSNECKKKCEALQREITTLREKEIRSERRLSKMYGYLSAIKGHLEKLGVVDIADIFDHPDEKNEPVQ